MASILPMRQSRRQREQEGEGQLGVGRRRHRQPDYQFERRRRPGSGRCHWWDERKFHEITRKEGRSIDRTRRTADSDAIPDEAGLQSRI